MPRPFTDITLAKNDTVIKNGSSVLSTTFRGKSSTLDTFVKNVPSIDEIYNKYGDRFYNGIFVQLAGNQTLIGG